MSDLDRPLVLGMPQLGSLEIGLPQMGFGEISEDNVDSPIQDGRFAVYRKMVGVLPVVLVAAGVSVLSAQSGCPSFDNDGDGFTTEQGDCDDSKAQVYLGAPEFCDGLDNDCDGTVDDGAMQVLYADVDGDGFGVMGTGKGGQACMWPLPTGKAMKRGDCDDANAKRYPGATDGAEDGTDDDCGGSDDPDPNVGLSKKSVEGLQLALDGVGQDTRTIWVGAGTYLEHNLDFAGKAVKLVSVDGAEQTVVDAEEQGTVVVFDQGEGADAGLDGFTLTGGLGSLGGGGCIQGSSPSISNSIITGNSATYGGGVYISGNSYPFFERVSVNGNEATDSGGGLFMGNGTMMNFKGGEVNYNTALIEGGGVMVDGGTAMLTTIVLNWNRALRGSAVYAIGAVANLNTCEIKGNIPTEGGALEGGVGAYFSLDQAIVDDNGDPGSLAGLFFADSSASANIKNSILVNNAIYNLYVLSGSVRLGYTDLYQATGAYINYSAPLGAEATWVGLSSVDPGFLTANDYHLLEFSPLVDLGDSNVVDIDGSRSDMGIYGGLNGGSWDRDGDGFKDYFWPGGHYDAPTGFMAAEYDANDYDSTVH
ncbi:MAG: NHL repeat-containing protein [Candidatus Peregrinibacteria bacterium GW2011_GWE2_39_6]|nr:MAG: NHL repeat-containing protein [Candidatus Peregrinibacteria bacterium GW2011_GWF2_39_17]KKR26611.1 MAG: NHL repeat-containing protein [Candidatus Peregrinibacteria bacterium GW2011_GWE2_39_6]HCW32486.1 hypothetical protein [Candidatus Peregrinibacteria bacterium]